MRQVLRGFLIAGILAVIVLGPQPIQAQYTADYQANIISGVASNWSGDYLVGSNTFADVLLIFDGGVLSNGYGYVGYEVGSSNNDVLVIGPGSVWKNFTDLSVPVDGNDLVVGNLGAGNSLVIGDGGKIVSGDGYLGYSSGSSNNSVLVTGPGSVWSNSFAMYFGYSGAGNSLVVSNGGHVINMPYDLYYRAGSAVGYDVSSSNNSVLVTGPGSVWMNVSDVSVGWYGSRNSLVVSDGAFVSGYSSELGVDSNSGNNSALVTGSGSAWSNTFAMYVGSSGAGNSLVISNGGKMSSAYFVIGDGPDSSSNNSVLVTGPGSVVSYTTIGDAIGEIYVGSSGAGNSLVISDGGQVFNTFASVGYSPGSSNNNVVVADTNSLWSSDRDLFIGGSEWSYDEDAGAGNTMVIRNGGEVVDSSGFIGGSPSSSDNSVLVTGAGSVWSNLNTLVIGSAGSGNSLVISEGGEVFDDTGYMGAGVGTSNDNVLVTGIGSVWSSAGTLYLGANESGEGVGGNSLVVSNAGLLICGNSSVGGDSNSVLITDSGSVWSNTTGLVFGASGNGNSLVISNGGQLFTDPSPSLCECLDAVGGWGSSSNSVTITGSGSAWNSPEALYIGYGDNAGNSVVIINGGKLANGGVALGAQSYGNSVLVTGSGSVWSNSSLIVGWYDSSANSLVISNEAQVFSRDNAWVGLWGTQNNVLIADGGIWRNNAISIGYQGSSNSITVAGGLVTATNLLIGVESAQCDNWVQLDSGSVIVTNATHDATLEVRDGVFILNGGVLQVDKLVMTNACGLFVRNGGTLIVGSVVLDPNLDADGDGLPNGWEQSFGLDPLDANGANGANGDPDGDGLTNYQVFLAGGNPVANIKTIAREGNDIRITWRAAAAKTNALQRSTGGNGGSYSNNFVDIYVVTDMVGGLRNYLDMGAATNFPAGYYRVRLVP